MEHVPLGFHVGAGRRFTRSLGIAGDLGWNRKTQTQVWELSFTTFSGGPRFYFGNQVTGFVHFLLGGIRRTETLWFEGQQYGESGTSLMFQPGGGVDISFSDAVALRVQLDGQWGDWFTAEDTSGNLRFVVGGVFYLGER